MNFHTLIIGAGTAGLTAARKLHNAGIKVAVLEAKDRIGGRVSTDRVISGDAARPVELGAEFIHGDRAPTWSFVRKLGLRTQLWRKLEDSRVRLADGSVKTMGDARAEHPDFDLTRTWALPDVDPMDGESILDYLRRVGLTETQIYYARRSWSNAVAESLENIDARAGLEDMGARALPGLPDAGSGDFRILDGYGRIHEFLAQGLDVRLNTPVTQIGWDKDGVRVTTTTNTLTAEHVLITVPLGVLQTGGITFDPPLPAHKQAAIRGLRMGPGMKMIYRFTYPITVERWTAIYSDLAPPMWWTSSPDATGAQVWTAFATGDWARALMADHDEALRILGDTPAGRAFALDDAVPPPESENNDQRALRRGLNTLRREVGDPTLVPEMMLMKNWTADPYAGGVYSVVPPGSYAHREALATPIGGRLFWAGEATAPNPWAATVNGAYESGLRSAAEILRVPYTYPTQADEQ